MIDSLLKAAYFIGLVAEIVIRMPYHRRNRRNRITEERRNREDMLLLSLLSLSMMFLPLIYTLTPWLAFANYQLPDWAGLLGILILAVALWVFWRAQVDLGRNWSPILQMREGHTLVTEGIYRYIRHPMYASQWLWSIAQLLLLQNWIVGLVGLLVFLPLYLERVPREEQMMIDHFGEEYRTYMQRTGRVIPHLI